MVGSCAADGIAVRDDRPTFAGLCVGVPAEILLDGERCSGGERAVDAVAPPFEVGIAIVCVHQGARSWLGHLLGMSWKANTGEGDDRCENCREMKRAVHTSSSVGGEIDVDGIRNQHQRAVSISHFTTQPMIMPVAGPFEG